MRRFTHSVLQQSTVHTHYIAHHHNIAYNMTERSRLRRVVLREVFVVVRMEDRLRGIALSEGLRMGLAVDIILSDAIDGEVRRLCHQHGQTSCS